MYPTMITRATMLRQPIARSTILARHPGNVLATKRFAQLDNRGGKSKLIFRFGLKDLPVEVYPVAFVVAAAVVGAAFALGKHLYGDGLRLAPTGKHREE